MPCSNPKHSHIWPTSGKHELRIKPCESRCGWCVYKTPKPGNLRKHALTHPKNLEFPQLRDITICRERPGRSRVAMQIEVHAPPQHNDNEETKTIQSENKRLQVKLHDLQDQYYRNMKVLLELSQIIHKDPPQPSSCSSTSQEHEGEPVIETPPVDIDWPECLTSPGGYYFINWPPCEEDMRPMPSLDCCGVSLVFKLEILNHFRVHGFVPGVWKDWALGFLDPDLLDDMDLGWGLLD